MSFAPLHLALFVLERDASSCFRRRPFFVASPHSLAFYLVPVQRPILSTFLYSLCYSLLRSSSSLYLFVLASLSLSLLFSPFDDLMTSALPRLGGVFGTA